MDVKTAIEKRRSVRKYQEDKEVSNADIIEIVEAGRTAPSWKNLQPWRFIIVRSQELREEVADCLIHPNPAKKSVKTASALIVLVGVPEEGATHQGKPFWMLDCGIAGQQMVLRAVELGLGTVWVSLLDSPRMAKVLGLPDGMECLGVFPLGYPLPDIESKKRTPRKDMSETTYLENYAKPLKA